MKKALFAILAAIGFSAATNSSQAFTHPGIPLTSSDLATLKKNLTTNPWASGYATLQADGHASLSYTMQGPFAQVSRNDGGSYLNEGAWESDMQAVFDLSLMWYFTGNTAYAQKAHDILIAWANTQTSYTGIEAAFDLADYAYCYAGGADILRGTWSGWTSSDTTVTQNYFQNVFWPDLGVPSPVGTGSQGMEDLTAAIAIAVFCDNQTEFNQTVSSLMGDADAGLKDTLPNGEVGDTGRDQGHTSLYIWDLAFIGEVCWKQGTDVFSVMDNRILATAEYYARFNQPGPTPGFVDFGAPFWGIFTNISGTPRSSGQDRRALNIINSAYAVRMGLCTPWTNAYCNNQNEDANSFVFRKSGDTSTATPAAVQTDPAVATVTSGLTDVDLHGSTPAGSSSYNSGTWTLKGGYNGGDPWSSGAPSVNFAYKSVSGNFTLVAKVNSLSGGDAGHSKAGILFTDSITGTAANQVYVALNPVVDYERGLIGYTNLPYGTNNADISSLVNTLPFWVKITRVNGNWIQTYVSQDGGSWSPVGTAIFANLPTTMYAGLFCTSFISGTTATATFSNVAITGGDGGAGASIPAAPRVVVTSPDEGQVVVRWTESFGATSYNIKRATSSGGPYSTVGSATNDYYTDATASDATTYYYVVSAVNSAGESANSSQDIATTPYPPMANIAFGGTATASANGTSSTEGAAMGFDINPGSKWFNGNGGTTGWLAYDFGSGNSQTIKRYAITSANDVPGRDPKNWQFQGSNDNSTWTTLDTQSNQSFAYRYQTNSYNLGNTTAYRYYRLNVTANNGDSSGVQLSELALATNQGHLLANGTYRLLNRRSNKAADVSNAGTANGTIVDQWTYNSGTNQQWTLTDQGNGQYQILGVGSGKALDVIGNSTSAGAGIDIWPWSGANNQRWTIVPTGNGFYKVVSVNSGLELDVYGGGTANGASLIQWSYAGSTDQQWSISVAP